MCVLSNEGCFGAGAGGVWGGGELGFNKGTQMRLGTPNVAANISRSNAGPVPFFESGVYSERIMGR